MPGQPKTRMLIAELERRATEEDLTVLDYVDHWIESGGTLLSLASDLADGLDLPVMRATLSRHLHSLDPAFDQRLTRARSISALAMADQTLEIADDSSIDPQRARVQVQARQWVAERFNKDVFGQPKGVSVSVTVGSLHLDALKYVSTLVTGTAQQALQSGSHNSGVQGAEVGEVIAVHDVTESA